MAGDINGLSGKALRGGEVYAEPSVMRGIIAKLALSYQELRHKGLESWAMGKVRSKTIIEMPEKQPLPLSHS